MYLYEYRLHPTSDSSFLPEDMHIPLIMERASNNGEKGLILPKKSLDEKTTSIHLLY